MMRALEMYVTLMKAMPRVYFKQTVALLQFAALNRKVVDKMRGSQTSVPHKSEEELAEYLEKSLRKKRTKIPGAEELERRLDSYEYDLKTEYGLDIGKVKVFPMSVVYHAWGVRDRRGLIERKERILQLSRELEQEHGRFTYGDSVSVLDKLGLGKMARLIHPYNFMLEGVSIE